MKDCLQMSLQTVANLPRNGHQQIQSNTTPHSSQRSKGKTQELRHLQASVGTLYVYGHGGTIRKRLNNYGFHGRVLLKKRPFLQRRKVWQQLNKPQVFGNSILWVDKTEVEMFGHHTQCHVWQKSNTQTHIATNTPYHLSSMVVVGVVIFGLFCSQRTWGNLQSLREWWTQALQEYSWDKCEATCPAA